MFFSKKKLKELVDAVENQATTYSALSERVGRVGERLYTLEEKVTYNRLRLEFEDKPKFKKGDKIKLIVNSDEIKQEGTTTITTSKSAIKDYTVINVNLTYGADSNFYYVYTIMDSDFEMKVVQESYIVNHLMK